MRGNKTATTGKDNQRSEDYGAYFIFKGQHKQFEDWDFGFGFGNGVEVVHAVHHCNAERPGCKKTNAHSGQDSDGNDTLWFQYLFCHVGRAVETVKRPVGVYQSDNEGNTIIRPTGLVDELCEDK